MDGNHCITHPSHYPLLYIQSTREADHYYICGWVISIYGVNVDESKDHGNIYGWRNVSFSKIKYPIAAD
jgi:hypothetical protein